MATDDELAAARREGELAALRRTGAVLVAAEFRAALAGRHDNPDAVAEHLDVPRFLTPNGDVDRDRVQAYADAVCTRPITATPASAQGKRQAVPAPASMNDHIRAAVNGGYYPTSSGY